MYDFSKIDLNQTHTSAIYTRTSSMFCRRYEKIYKIYKPNTNPNSNPNPNPPPHPKAQ